MFDINIDEIEDLPKGLSEGEHFLTVAKAELKETKTRDGLYIKVEFVADNGQKHWENFNIQNKNEKAQKIGLGQLKEFLKAGDFKGSRLNDVNLMCGLRVLAKVKIKDEGQYGKNPRITSYKSAVSEGSKILKAADPFV